MAASTTPLTALTPDDPAKAARKRTFMLVVFISIGIHVAAGLGAGIWVVVKFLEPPPAQFIAKKPVAIPPKILEQKMATAEMEALAAKPTFDDKISSMRPTDFALPDVPPMPMEDIMPLDPSTIVSDSVTSLVGQAGAGMGAGGGLGGAGGFGDGVSFFGLTSSGKSVVILFDISTSVITKAEKAGLSITKIQSETMTLLKTLSINVTFNLIQFSRGYVPFKQFLVAPTDANRQEAQKWMETEFSTTGSVKGKEMVKVGHIGFPAVLEAGLKMNPDIVYILSDGDFQRTAAVTQVPMEDIAKVIDAHNKERMEPTQINFLGLEMKPEQKSDLSRIVRKTGGRLKEIGK
jgi:hypothetical protein